MNVFVRDAVSARPRKRRHRGEETDERDPKKMKKTDPSRSPAKHAVDDAAGGTVRVQRLCFCFCFVLFLYATRRMFPYSKTVFCWPYTRARTRNSNRAVLRGRARPGVLSAIDGHYDLVTAPRGEQNAIRLCHEGLSIDRVQSIEICRRHAVRSESRFE